MKLLALETSTEACSVALWLDGEVRERHEIANRRGRRQHGRALAHFVQSLLNLRTTLRIVFRVEPEIEQRKLELPHGLQTCMETARRDEL